MIRTKFINRDVIQPFYPEHLQPNSYDVHLGDEFLIPKKYRLPQTIFEDELEYDEAKDEVILHKGDFILATTKETVRVPAGKCAFLIGRSSAARWGVQIHLAAGFIDSGFNGQITLEVVNHAPYQVRLVKDVRIGQLVFMDCETARMYNGHYQNQVGTTKAAKQ